MKIKTAKGIELKCDSVTSIPSPMRLYLHLIDIGVEAAVEIFGDRTQLPIEGYPLFTVLQNVSPEGPTRVKVSLKGE